MTRHTVTILLALSALLAVGCSSGFRAGGERAGVAAGSPSPRRPPTRRAEVQRPAASATVRGRSSAVPT
jgi:hypothetical protein